MAGKDPAFLFYPADASEDTQFMNRLERGCYFDIMKAQKKFPRFTLEIIKKVLGRDFETCWSAIESVLKKDENGFFIEWVDNSIEKRKEFSKLQSDRIKNYHNRKSLENDTVVEPNLNHGSTNVEPLGNGNGNGNRDEIEKGNKGVQGEILKCPFESQDFKDAWRHWKDYKKLQHKFSYKAIHTEQAAINELIKNSGGLEETAIAIIMQSMANGWKGFFKLNENTSNATGTGKNTANNGGQSTIFNALKNTKSNF
jgi:hypothetical protein